FGVPLDDWFRHPNGVAFVRERLLSAKARQLGFWDTQGVEKIIKLHQRPRGRGFGLLLWRLLVLEAWTRHYLAGAASSSSPQSLSVVWQRGERHKVAFPD